MSDLSKQISTLFYCDNKDNTILNVRVTTKAAKNQIKITSIDGIRIVRVYVTAVPEDDKANKAVIKLLAKELQIPHTRITIINGAKSKDKTLSIAT